MNARNNHGHPELETLLAHAEGERPTGAAEVAAHLESCPLCRLEVKRFQRFLAMGGNPQEDREAQWDQAERQLERAWQDKIRPAAPRAAARNRRWLWLVPAAAAAGAAFFFLQPPAPVGPGPLVEPAATVVRGAGDLAAPEIELREPRGELRELPRQFAWETGRECTSFTLVLFTADLKQVFSRPGITTSRWEITPELESLLEPQTIYLWSVRGHRDLRVVAESENGWFTLVP